MYCSLSICKFDVLWLRCLDCHEDQDTQHVTTISSLHRSKVGSISAAEAVKSLQQPVLLKADPLRSRGGLIFSRTLHSYPRLHSHQSWYLCDRVYWRQTRMWPLDKHRAGSGPGGGHQETKTTLLPRPPAASLPPLRLRSAIVNLGI